MRVFGKYEKESLVFRFDFDESKPALTTKLPVPAVASISFSSGSL